MKYPVILILTAALCLSGCESEIDSESDISSKHIEKYNSVIIKYIQKQNPPDLESIEPWQNIYGPGVKLTTAHYEIFATFMDQHLLRRIPAFIESAYWAYNEQFPEPIPTSAKFTIYLFADRTQWEHFTWTFAGRQAEMFYKIKAGAYYHNGACVTYNIGPDRTLSALAHEGWHQFCSRHFKYRLPSWLDEGVAMQFETFSNKNGAIIFEPDNNEYRTDGLKKTLEANSMIPLRELTAINPGQVLAIDQTEAVSAFYSQSYALVRFLKEAYNGRYLAIYNQLLADGLWGKWPLDEVSSEIATDRNLPRTILWNHIVGTQLFQRYIHEDFERVEWEYLAFCRKIIQ